MEISRFNRMEMILGKESLSKLSSSHVAVFGLGGVGSYTVEALARAGVGELTIIDNDTISVTNINRQLYALSSTVGKNKTEVALERIKDINPECKVNVITKFYLPEIADEFFENKFDYIADAIDTVSAKLSLAVEAQNRNIPIIACMGTGNKLDPTLITISDINKTSTCPLCRVMRRELKLRNVKKLKVVWSPEAPLKPSESNENVSKRAVPGSVSFVPPVAGMIMAGEIVKDLMK